MHQRLQSRELAITERTVTHLMHRYEELVALRITDSERIKARLQKQGHVILALDGLQPDAGHEVLWVVRDCLSEEILLARPLFSNTQGNITALLQEVKQILESLKVPIKGIISDGQETIRSAVAFVFLLWLVPCVIPLTGASRKSINCFVIEGYRLPNGLSPTCSRATKNWSPSI